jgi:hypothetical protein
MSQGAVDILARAAGDLKITRRADKDRGYISLCMLDAVYSVGARYTAVVRVCHTYARHAGLEVATLPHREANTVIGTDAEQSLAAFVADIHGLGVAGFALTSYVIADAPAPVTGFSRPTPLSGTPELCSHMTYASWPT